jgi:hypothetical protein
MVIAIDLDNTLFNNNIVELVCMKNDIDPPEEFDLSDLPEHVQMECWSAFGDIKMMCNLQPFPTSLGIDSQLQLLGHDVVVVTSRSKEMERATIRMLYTHFKEIDDVFVVGSYDKTEAYNTIKADVVVDDNASHIHQAIDCGVPIPVLISNDKTSYNHSEVDDVIERGAYVIDNLSELIPLLRGLYE